ncbi:hypothetical protein T09_14206 [Trichinella sp. T9]|nr:hypothetical protein T09_14206 [Trichinella sp. T9]
MATLEAIYSTRTAGAMGDEIKQVVLKIRNGNPFDEYLYKNYDIFPPSNVRNRNSICT